MSTSASDPPKKYGGFASIPTWAYKYGQYTLLHITLYQDQWGVIRQQRHGRPSRDDDVVVPADRNPSSGGFGLAAWGLDVQGATPLEVRVYWLNTLGQIYERCFSQNGGPGAVWYDGSLVGQFKAATYSSIAANTSNGAKTHVYFQDVETDELRELYKEGQDTFDPFVLVKKTRPAALKGTRIATDSNTNGTTEVYYQSPSLEWVLDGAGVQSGFAPHNEFPYAPGAAIAVAGSVAQGGARVVTVNKEGRIVMTTYDKASLKWSPSVELVRIQTGRQIWVSNHPPPSYANLFRHSTTIVVPQSGDYSVITRVGFTDSSFDGWDVLPSDTAL